MEMFNHKADMDNDTGELESLLELVEEKLDPEHYKNDFSGRTEPAG